jgi:hypothetical protein
MKLFDRFKARWSKKVADRAAQKALEDAFKNATPSKARSKYRRTGYMLQPGFAWNPLTGYPRNKGCFCGSGVKAKRCCMPYINRACAQKEADILNDIWPKLMTGRLTLPRAPQAQKKLDEKEKAEAPAPAPAEPADAAA